MPQLFLAAGLSPTVIEAWAVAGPELWGALPPTSQEFGHIKVFHSSEKL